MSSYIFTISKDFRTVPPNMDTLNDSVLSSGISSTLKNFYNSGDEIVFIFSPELSESDVNNLNNIISSYLPKLKKRVTFFCRNNEITTTTFKRVSNGVFPSTKYATASINSYMDSSATSYDVMIFDKTNKQILLAKNLSNTEESTMQLGSLNNLSSSECDIEISVKKNDKNGKSKVYVENINIFYK